MAFISVSHSAKDYFFLNCDLLYEVYPYLNVDMETMFFIFFDINMSSAGSSASAGGSSSAVSSLSVEEIEQPESASILLKLSDISLPLSKSYDKASVTAHPPPDLNRITIRYKQ